MKKLTTIFFLFISFSVFAQSPWAQEKDKFYTQLSFTTIANYNEFFGNPDFSIAGSVTDNTFQFYTEYGLSDKTSLLLNIPLKAISVNDVDRSTVFNVTPSNPVSSEKTSLGNISLGIKHNFYKKDWVLSGQFLIETNTSTYDANSGIRTGYDAWSFTPLFLVGRGFGKTYIQGFIGADIRTNDYSSNFKIGGEIGRKLGKHIWLIGFLDISKSFKNGDFNNSISDPITFLYVNDQEYGAFGLKGIGEFTNKFGVTASFGGAFFGNNVAKQAALNFGVYHKF